MYSLIMLYYTCRILKCDVIDEMLSCFDEMHLDLDFRYIDIVVNRNNKKRNLTNYAANPPTRTLPNTK